MCELLKGKSVADVIYDDIKTRLSSLSCKGKVANIALLRIGDRQDDVAYESMVVKKARSLGIDSVLYHFSDDVSQDEVAAAIDEINSSFAIDGCLAFRPFPKHLDEAALCNMLDPKKDLDGIGAVSLAGVFMDIHEGFAPATAEACVRLLQYYGIELEGAHVVVVGRSLVIGKPVGMLLLEKNASVTFCHSKSKDLASITKAADVVICAVGRPEFFGPEYFSARQVVLDVGMNVSEDGSLCGDVDFDAVKSHVAALTPVPGGVGGVTTAVMLEHLVSAAQEATDICLKTSR